jgi:hypothetical protein
MKAMTDTSTSRVDDQAVPAGTSLDVEMRRIIGVDALVKFRFSVVMVGWSRVLCQRLIRSGA